MDPDEVHEMRAEGRALERGECPLCGEELDCGLCPDCDCDDEEEHIS